MLQSFRKTIPFSLIRHNDTPCYVREGYGGKPIEDWPVYGFICEYLEGKKGEAFDHYERWYIDQLSKYSTVPNNAGGMYKGSLYLLIERRAGAPFKDVPISTKTQAIHERVQQRFALVDSIKKKGYDANSERIEAVKKNGYVYLRGGHHRAAALRALDYDALPGILVFPNEFIYNIVTLLRKIKKWLFSKIRMNISGG